MISSYPIEGPQCQDLYRDIEYGKKTPLDIADGYVEGGQHWQLPSRAEVKRLLQNLPREKQALFYGKRIYTIGANKQKKSQWECIEITSNGKTREEDCYLWQTDEGYIILVAR